MAKNHSLHAEKMKSVNQKDQQIENLQVPGLKKQESLKASNRSESAAMNFDDIQR